MSARRYQLPRPTVGVSRWRRFQARFDWPLFIGVALVTAVGLFNLYSATADTPHSTKFDQQVRWVVIGSAAYFVMAFLDYRTLVRVAWIALGLAVVALIAVQILGYASKGAQRWIGWGPVRVQPSELAKLAVILALARTAQDNETSELDLRQLLPRLLAVFVPVALIVAQPDLGSGTLTALIILSIGFLSFRNVWPMVAVSVAGMAMIPLLWEKMHHYQKQRVLAFLDPEADPTGAAWHTQQSILAVGSGQVTGKGYLEATQNRMAFLPEHWTDFPFSVWGEEWGFVGAILLLFLFGFLIVWCLNIALTARDKAGSVICIGAAAMIFWHTYVNVSMVLGMAPVVGVTLPFISYGGSSLLTFFLALGMVSSVSLRRHGF